VSICGGMDMTLFEVDEAATRIREEVDADADIIVGAIFDQALAGKFRVSVVATGLRKSAEIAQFEQRIA
jgi:cell division protein FtsZ